MSILRYAAGVPAVAAVVATLYGGLSYVNGLQNTIELNEKTIMVMQTSADADADKFNMLISNNHRELTNMIKSLETGTKNTIDMIETGAESALANEVEKLSIKVSSNTLAHAQAREELVIQVADLHTSINRAVLLGEALRDQLYLKASESELRAMEQSYYKLSDSINQMKYDLKEMTRQLNGGY